MKFPIDWNLKKGFMIKIKSTSDTSIIIKNLEARSMRKRSDKLIFWPAYFEKNISRAEGRKIPINLAAPDVTLNTLKYAAESAGFEYEVEPDKEYPRYWSEKHGYIVVNNEDGHKKKRVLLMLAKGVRRAIAKRESERLAEESKKSKKKRRKR